MTEYILVLVVVVAIILGGVYQLNSAFKVWANNYFGEYLACLLETGELPSIGGTPGDSGICNSLFQPFELALGRPYKEPGDPGKTEPTEQRGGDEKGKGVSEANNGSRRSYVSAGRSSSSRFGRSGGLSSSERGQNIGKGKEKSTYTGSAESSIPMGAGYSNNYEKNSRVRYGSIDNRRILDAAEEKKETEKTGRAITKSEAPSADKSRVRLLKRDIAKTTEETDSSFTIGNFLRFLIIAAIVIALLLLLGSQAMQISKNSSE